jgi:DNA topoisomerase I
MTTRERLENKGIRRIGSPSRGFNYKRADGQKITAVERKRIEELRIPPAWKDVRINPSPGGPVQVIGTDAAGRSQYLYHQHHVRRQEGKKFQRLIKFAEALPALRVTIASHLNQEGLGKERVLACILRIISTSFMRPGSQVYASENGSYGIATLRPKHIKVKGDVIEFDFPGKSGVRQQRQLRDRQVAKVVRSLLRYPSREVFKYQNGSGEFVNITRQHINTYIREVMGENFSAKDFRTWAGTLVCACALARVGAEANGNKTLRKRLVVKAIKETAEALGNTPAVCRSAYISPEILNQFDDGKIIPRYFNKLDDFIKFRGRKLHPAEKSLLNFMKRNWKK